LGEHDTRISVIASDAEHTVFLKKGSFASRKTDDMLLLQETERALADKSSPKVIFLHMMGSHPNPCDRLHSWSNNYQERFPRKIACYLASISKLDNFLGQLDGILRRHSRHFAGIFQWLTGIRTENIPPFNPLTDEDNELIMVFNGDKNVPTDSLESQPLILPGKGK
ncbi:TPA: sulfatase-like hydrolase/transferase, partial [Escherichia coli]|nr:sulfatase-like hydrolase/transferase [Escherichia coli]